MEGGNQNLYKSEGAKKGSTEAGKRGDVLEPPGKHHKVNAVFHYLKTGGLLCICKLKITTSLGSAPITVQPNGSLSGMMNRS